MTYNIPTTQCTTLNEAVVACTNTIQSGDCVLLSPAGSSYDLYENYEQRGRHFKELIMRFIQRQIMISKKLPLYGDLHVFLTIIATLILIGCLFVYSSSSVYALETFGTSLFFVKRQCAGLIIRTHCTLYWPSYPTQFH